MLKNMLLYQNNTYCAMERRFFLIVASITVISFHINSIVSAQANATSDSFSQKVLGLNTEKKQSYKISIPFLSSENLRTLAILGAGVFLISKSDRAIDEEYALEGQKFPFSLIQSYGKAGIFYDTGQTFYYLGGISAAAVGYSLISGNKEPAKTVGLMLESLAVSSVITFILKTTVGRHRPYTNHGPYRFNSFNFSLNATQMSFPSGHTSSIFAMMTVIAKRSQSTWVKLGAYSFAASVAFQRMLDRKHWASDVIVGGAIGYLVGSTLVKKHNTRSQKVSLAPFVEPDKIGVGINF